MTTLKLIIKTLLHYPMTSLATAAGIAVSSAIICGAFIIGDSLRMSLEQIVEYRLGEITHTITAGDRLFQSNIDERLSDEGLFSASILKTEGVAAVQGSDARINRVSVWGADNRFEKVIGAKPETLTVGHGQAIISENIANRLNVDTGDFLLLRLETINPTPPNTPFVSDANRTVSRRVEIKNILSKDDFGHFNLNVSQSAPFNIFVDKGWLNLIMGLDDRANILTVSTGENGEAGYIKDALQNSWQLEDIGLQLSLADEFLDFKLTSERVFIDEYAGDKISEALPGSQLHLTYFVNSIRHGEYNTPYSFINASDKYLSNNQNSNAIFINQWLADDLKAEPGDTLKIKFFVVGPLRELEEYEAEFLVSGIINMDEAVKDSILMPHLPGLSDAVSCLDWDAGVPIDLDRIRQKDEDYWDDFKGTPKGYISLNKGMELWQNRFGNLTTIIFPGKVYDEAIIRGKAIAAINPFNMGFQLNEVRKRGIEAARGGVDFSSLFAGLGMFVIVAGLLLTALLVQYNLNKKQNQVKLFAYLGYSKPLIRKIIAGEAFIIIIIGVMAGLVLSIGYSRLVFEALNTIWHDIVRTDVLMLHINSLSILPGLAISAALGFIVVMISINKTIGVGKSNKDRKKRVKKNYAFKKFVFTVALAFSVLTVFVAAYLILLDSQSLLLWFITGLLMLAALLSWAYYLLNHFGKPLNEELTISYLSLKNLARSPVRSFTIISLLALGCFVIIVTAANRKEMTIDPYNKAGGTGGYQFIVESTVPVLKNLNDRSTKLDLGVPERAAFMQFFSAYDDDASCHNLNRVANPRILAASPSQLEGRFSFVRSKDLPANTNPWLLLEKKYNDVIPAIADQAVIQWGLNKSVGDTLRYFNSKGEEIRLLLVGGIDNSVLQGNVIISLDNFLNHFPTSEGTDVILVETPEGESEKIAEGLGFIFRDYGWEVTPTEQKLAEFNSVENTYLRIFFLLGAFGMLLGTVGLAVVVANTLLQRRSETALYRALGFGTKTILRLYFNEYLLIFLAGIIAGFVPAIIATLPTYMAGIENVSTGFLFAILAILIVNGVFWILLTSLSIIKKQKLVESLFMF